MINLTQKIIESDKIFHFRFVMKGLYLMPIWLNSCQNELQLSKGCTNNFVCAPAYMLKDIRTRTTHAIV